EMKKEIMINIKPSIRSRSINSLVKLLFENDSNNDRRIIFNFLISDFADLDDFYKLDFIKLKKDFAFNNTFDLALTLDLSGFSYEFRSGIYESEIFPTTLCFKNIKKTSRILISALTAIDEKVLEDGLKDYFKSLYLTWLVIPSLYIRPINLSLKFGCLCDNCPFFKNAEELKRIIRLHKDASKFLKNKIKRLEKKRNIVKDVVVYSPKVSISSVREYIADADEYIELEDVETDKLKIRNRMPGSERKEIGTEFDNYNFSELSKVISDITQKVLEDEKFRSWSTYKNLRMMEYNIQIFQLLNDILNGFTFGKEMDTGFLISATPLTIKTFVPIEIITYDFLEIFSTTLSKNIIEMSNSIIIDINIAKHLSEYILLKYLRNYIGPIGLINYINFKRFINSVNQTVELAEKNENSNFTISHIGSKYTKEFINRVRSL
ncbi:MAG: hypothetical protein J7L07_08065, partial [Candidatus Odinarchaeota archaeon]|nr:hypothetical protein [Candidatus Odinarchaeota archaeon]